MTESKLHTVAKIVSDLAKETDSDPLEILEFLEGCCWSEEEGDRIQDLLDVGYAEELLQRRFKMYQKLKEEFGND